jgi:hypothetical protein
LREAVDTFYYFPDNKIVLGQVGHPEVGPVLRGDQFDWKAHVFGSVQDTLEVEIRNIHGDMVSVVIAYHSVEEALDGGSVDSGATTITIIVGEVATNGEAYTQDIGTAGLRFAGGDNGCVHSSAAGGNAWDNMHCFGGEHEAVKFIEERLLPFGAIRSVQLGGVFTRTGEAAPV